MSTPQNGAAAFAREVFRCLPGGFRLPECPSPMVGPHYLQMLASGVTVFSQLLMQTPRVWLARRYRVTRT